MKNKVWKKVLSAALAMAMTASLTACAGAPATTAAPAADTAAASTEEAAPAEESTDSAPSEGAIDMSGVSLNFWSDKVGSGTYNIIVAMSKILEEKGGFAEVNVDPSYPGGMGAPYIFKANNVDLSFANGAPAKWAMEEGTLGNPPTDGYKAAIGSLTAVCYVNLITNDFLEKYNVSSLEEIFEQKLPLRIGCSPRGSMDAEGAYRMLEYFGVTLEDLQSWGGDIIEQGGDANAEAIADGQIDFYVDHTSSSSSTMAQIASTVDVTFLQWSDEMCQWFMDTLGFDLITIPANSFKGQTEDLHLPGSPDALFVNENLDDDVVYMIVKTLSENRDELVNEYASLEPWDPATAWEASKRGGVDLHPGAERYYKEMGYMN
ncbi:MAG: hypothetical protein IJT16_01260 [Lachnospiraceae bacterium]|nr:hypothetical protein [Lachnospiraceae bacterium]